MKSGVNKIVAASTIGTILEWFDFFIYANAAILVFNKVFFPQEDPVVGMLLALMTYAVGIVARPFGGALFGHIGDTKGRKYALMLSTMLMGLCTFAIGLLPTYNSIGVWAAVMLVALRILQGLSFGGEFGAAALMIYENVPANRRGFYGSFIQLANPAGIFLAAACFYLLSQLPQEDFISWGWRIPFLASVILIAIGGYIRSQLTETLIFQQMVAKKQFVKNPFWDILKNQPKKLFVAAGVKLNEVTNSYCITAFIIAYATTKLGLPKQELLNALMIACLISISAMPLYGYISDKIGCKPILYVGCIIVLLMAFPMFVMVNSGDLNSVKTVIIAGHALGTMLSFALMPSFLPRLFDQKIRTTGVGFSSNIAAGIGGGLLPLLSGYMVAKFNSTTGISVMLVTCAIVSAICIFLAKEEE
jgi:MHS family shikimate/dehydroshikimate transporter-like MFS transporter